MFEDTYTTIYRYLGDILDYPDATIAYQHVHVLRYSNQFFQSLRINSPRLLILRMKHLSVAWKKSIQRPLISILRPTFLQVLFSLVKASSAANSWSNFNRSIVSVALRRAVNLLITLQLCCASWPYVIWKVPQTRN